MRIRYWLLIALILATANILVYKDLFAPAVLSVHVLSMGEGLPAGKRGDAVLVKSPSGKTLLIDTGRDASILRALGANLPFWQRDIDAVIITSKATASSGGLPEVEDRYHIGTLIRSGVRGDRLFLGDGAYVDVLWPPQTAGSMNTADGALVLRISYGATSFLIQNNLPPRASAWLAALDKNLPVPNVVISSSTPADVYISDGKRFQK